MRRAAAPVRFGLLLALASAGCKDDPPAPASPPPAAEPETTTQLEIQPRPLPRLTVDDPGAEPHQTVMLTPTAGASIPVVVTLAMKMSMRAGGQAMPAMATPRVELRGRVIVDAVRPDEILARHLVDAVEIHEGADVPAMLVATLREAVPALSTYRASLRFDPHGSLRGGSVEVPAGVAGPGAQLLQQLTDAVAQLQVPLPTEPIGVGAKWSATVPLEQGGMRLQQRVDYVLVSRHDDRLEIVTSVEQTLRDPVVELPGMPGGAMEVELFQSHGEGTVEVDLTALVPVRAETALDVRIVLAARGDGPGAGAQEFEMSVQAGLSRD